MNEIKILILSFLAFLVADCGMPKKLQTETTSIPTITIEDFVGVWSSKNFGEDEIMYGSLELHLEKDNTKENALRGWHCAVIRGGRQIDCTEYNEEPRISGYLKDDTVYLHFINNWEIDALISRERISDFK